MRRAAISKFLKHVFHGMFLNYELQMDTVLANADDAFSYSVAYGWYGCSVPLSLKRLSGYSFFCLGCLSVSVNPLRSFKNKFSVSVKCCSVGQCCCCCFCLLFATAQPRSREVKHVHASHAVALFIYHSKLFRIFPCFVSVIRARELHLVS